VNSREAILLSIRPEFVRKIRAGIKTVEIRRRFPRCPPGRTLVVYETAPTSSVVGTARIVGVHRSHPAELWERFGPATSVDLRFFEKYFEGRQFGYAVEVGDFEEFNPLTVEQMREFIPGFVAPQSYRYLSQTVLQVLRRSVVR